MRAAPCPAGAVRLKGRLLAIGKYGDALRHGIAYLSEDRKAAGVFLELSVAQNISAMAPRRVSSRWGLLSRMAESKLAQDLGGG